jgi:hypothetical protein
MYENKTFFYFARNYEWQNYPVLPQSLRLASQPNKLKCIYPPKPEHSPIYMRTFRPTELL